MDELRPYFAIVGGQCGGNRSLVGEAALQVHKNFCRSKCQYAFGGSENELLEHCSYDKKERLKEYNGSVDFHVLCECLAGFNWSKKMVKSAIGKLQQPLSFLSQP
jgi:hypothetical protein